MALSKADADQMRTLLGRNSAIKRMKALNTAIKFVRYLTSREDGTSPMDVVDITEVPKWEIPAFDREEKGQVGSFNLRSSGVPVTVEWPQLVAQLGPVTYDALFEDNEDVEYAFFMRTGTMGVKWAKDKADWDFVLLTATKRVHLHPSSDGRYHARIAAMDEPLAPAGAAAKGYAFTQVGDPPTLHGGLENPDLEEFVRGRREPNGPSVSYYILMFMRT